MKRYEVVIFSHDLGADTITDFDHFLDAVNDAKRYKSEEYVAIYDSKYRIAYVILGDPHTTVFVDTVKVIELN